MTEATTDYEGVLVIGGPHSGKLISVQRGRGSIVMADETTGEATPDPEADTSAQEDPVVYPIHRLWMGRNRTLGVAMHSDATEDDLWRVILTEDTQRALGVIP